MGQRTWKSKGGTTNDPPFCALRIILICTALLAPAHADFPVRQGTNTETTPVVAYNPTNHEYLAVWTEEFMFGGIYRLQCQGAQGRRRMAPCVGEPFTIAPFVAYPTVAYNAHVNEYVVAGTSYGNIVCQRVSSSGGERGKSRQRVLPGGAKARIVCNSITGEYLVVGHVHTPSSPDTTVRYYSCRVSADLQTVSPVELLISQGSGGLAQTRVSRQHP